MAMVKIHTFQNLSNYQICGGITHLKWEVSNNLCTFLVTNKSIQFFTKTTETILLTNGPQKYNLVAFGLFSISKKTIWLNPVKLNSDKKKFQKIVSGKISISNLKNKKISPVIGNSFPKKIELKIKEITP
tara:strand:+ start:5450 stop:5839 length:390 start_codon:yes stop_codon:yes gene_type:complete